jgi:2-oxoglutarate ferredoxin oxidoreductase subunit beta
LASGFTFVARGYSFESEHLKDLIKKAVEHKGSAFVDALQICVTYNDVHTVDYYNDRLYKMDEGEDWDPVVGSPSEDEVQKKLMQAMQKSMEWGDRIPLSLFYQNPYVSTFEERLSERIPIYGSIAPAKQRILDEQGSTIIDEEKFRKLFEEMIVEVKK